MEYLTLDKETKMDAHVAEWMFWEFKKDKVCFWFPFAGANPVIDITAV